MVAAVALRSLTYQIQPKSSLLIHESFYSCKYETLLYKIAQTSCSELSSPPVSHSRSVCVNTAVMTEPGFSQNFTQFSFGLFFSLSPSPTLNTYLVYETCITACLFVSDPHVLLDLIVRLHCF